MTRLHNLCVGAVALLGLLWGSTAAAGEFRTTAGKRTIQRVAAKTEQVPQSAAPAPLESMDDFDVEELESGECCDDGSCDACSNCLPSGTLATSLPSWTNVDFLLWWRGARDYPSLVTTSPIGTSADNAGQLGLPGTQTLFGGRAFDENARPGGRIDLGYWLDSCECFGIGGGFFALGDETNDFNLDSTANRIIARPFLNVTDGQIPQQDTLLIAFPGESTGSIRIASHSDLLGADAYVRQLFTQTCNWRIDVLGGYRFFRIDEDLRISNELTALNTSQLRVPGTTLSLFDQFDARNEFHGGQFGLLTEYRFCRFTVDGLLKIALGNMAQTVTVRGQTIINDTVNTAVDEQGLLARSTNRGVHEQNEFSVVTELGVKGKYQLNGCVDLTVGYNFLSFSDVALPDNQIDSSVNLANPPTGAQRPAFSFNSSDYSVHGLSLGIQGRF